MKAASILIKPSSSNCNIDCSYCFYKKLSSKRTDTHHGFMSDETLEMLIKNAFDYADSHITFAFQGGEPTLCGIDFFKKAMELEKKYNINGINVENTIQTNGLLIDEQWCDLLKKNNFLAGLSLDGFKDLHDRHRKDNHQTPTFDKVMKTVRLFEEYGVSYNILSVITDDTCPHAKELYDFYKENHFQYIQLIPCLYESDKADEHLKNTSEKLSEYQPDSDKYGAFLCELFDCWIKDFDKGYIEEDGNTYPVPDIRLFSNLAQMAAGYPPEECGLSGHCTCYFAVEWNGDVYPCDFYCSDKWKLGTLEKPFAILERSEKAKDFVKSSYDMDEECKTCRYHRLCRGGCRRWREEPDGSQGIYKLCDAYKLFLKHTESVIDRLGHIILDAYGPYTINRS